MLGQLKTFAMSIALAMADDSLELPAEDDLAKFSKLRTAAKYIAAKRTGDAAAAEKLDKALAASKSEHERILSALEDKAFRDPLCGCFNRHYLEVKHASNWIRLSFIV